MSDDFFSKIDGELSEQKAAATAKADLEKKNIDWLKSIMPKLIETAQEYAEKCRAKGMNASVKGGDRYVTFTLRYAKGGEYSLVGSGDHEHAQRLSFETHYPNDDGKRYRSLPSAWYDESNWSDDVFTTNLEKTITDFVSYAPRHGGI